MIFSFCKSFLSFLLGVFFYFLLFCILFYFICIKRIVLKNIDTNKIFYLNSTIEKSLIDNAILKLKNIPVTFTEEHKKFYFIIDSQGGDFDQGNLLINVMKIKRDYQKIEFICIAKYASSMAFYIFQHCDQRFILWNSVLMSHPLKISFSGEIEDIELWYKTEFHETKYKEKKIIQYVTNKINMDIKEYKEKIKKDWFIKGGFNILLFKLADKMIILDE